MSLNHVELEELARAMHEDSGITGNLTHEDIAKRFFDASWAALCHNTDRAARFYQPDDTSPEARIYRLMGEALRSDG